MCQSGLFKDHLTGLWFTEASGNVAGAPSSTAHMLFKNNPPLHQEVTDFSTTDVLLLLFIYSYLLLFTSHNMSSIALSFTTVNVVSLRQLLKLLPAKGGKRKISHGDKPEAQAGKGGSKVPSLKQRCTSLCPVDCKGLRVQQEHFHTQYPRAVSVQRLEHPLREKEEMWRGGGAEEEVEVGGCELVVVG